MVLTGDDLPGAVLDYAGRNNVTQIVIGKSRDSCWRLVLAAPWPRPCCADPAARPCTSSASGAPDAEPRIEVATATRPIARAALWRGYVGVGLLAVAANVLAFLLDRYSTGADLAMIFLASVLVSGLAWGLRPALVGRRAGDPDLQLLLPGAALLLRHRPCRPTSSPSLIFLAVAVVTGWLTGRVRDQAQLSSPPRRRRHRPAGRQPPPVRRRPRKPRPPRPWPNRPSAAAGGKAVVLLPRRTARLVQVAGAPATAAAHHRRHGRRPLGLGEGRAGRRRHRHPAAGRLDLPAAAGPARPRRASPASRRRGDGDADEERLVAALLDQGAVALERAELAAATVETEALRRSDQLRAALLNSISHDLRTPLSTVLGSATTLIDYRQDPEAGGARRPADQHPRGGRAAEPLCRRPAGHDPAGRRRR